ncbi:MAG: antitoxin [Mogibacterium sp.]|nr:antitoxin [Mogibacterium sp.]
MRDEYDFANMKGEKNPYAKILKKQIPINVNNNAIDYFKGESARTGIPYQTLINLYLTDCAENKRKLNISWK